MVGTFLEIRGRRVVGYVIFNTFFSSVLLNNLKSFDDDFKNHH